MKRLFGLHPRQLVALALFLAGVAAGIAATRGSLSYRGVSSQRPSAGEKVPGLIPIEVDLSFPTSVLNRAVPPAPDGPGPPSMPPQMPVPSEPSPIGSDHRGIATADIPPPVSEVPPPGITNEVPVRTEPVTDLLNATIAVTLNLVGQVTSVVGGMLLQDAAATGSVTGG